MIVVDTTSSRLHTAFTTRIYDDGGMSTEWGREGEEEVEDESVSVDDRLLFNGYTPGTSQAALACYGVMAVFV